MAAPVTAVAAEGGNVVLTGLSQHHIHGLDLLYRQCTQDTDTCACMCTICQPYLTLVVPTAGTSSISMTIEDSGGSEITTRSV